MQIISQNLRKNELKLRIENIDDLWHLSQLIEPGDIIKGQTIRKVRIGEKEQRKTETVKKKIFIILKAEKIDFKEDALRVSGTIQEAPEDIPKGSHHSFNLEQGSVITLFKEKWFKFHLDKIKEAASFRQPSILICILDREEAIFAVSKRTGYEIITSIQGEVQKKEEKAVPKGSFYEEIIKLLKEYSSRYRAEHIIAASPAFWKEELMKHIKEKELRNRITLATCSSVSKNAITEVLKRPETKEVLKRDRISKETNLIECLLAEISKNGLAAYGLKETEKAAIAGAVRILLITDRFVQKKREEGKYEAIDSLLKAVDQTKGEIHIISSEFEAGKKLDSLGGIGAILRYKLSY